MTRLIIWRHGRTEWNAIGRIQGQTDTHLDEIGLAQAASAAPTLAALRPDMIISSDLARASATAAALAARTGLSVDLDPRLRERDFGPWQGKTQVEISRLYPEEFANWVAGKPQLGPDIESLEDMYDRVGAALRDAAGRVGAEGTAVVISHGAAARVGCGALLGWPIELTETLGGLGNCRYAELRHTPQRGWQLRAHNV